MLNALAHEQLMLIVVLCRHASRSAAHRGDTGEIYRGLLLGEPAVGRAIRLLCVEPARVPPCILTTTAVERLTPNPDGVRIHIETQNSVYTLCHVVVSTRSLLLEQTIEPAMCAVPA